MISVVFLSLLLIIFPLFFNIQIALNTNYKKFYFRVCFYKIKILSGYIEINKKGINVHVSDKKCFIIHYNKLFNKNKKLDFIITSFYANVSIYNKNILNSILIGVIINHLLSLISKYNFKKKPINIYKEINTYEEKNSIRVYLQVKCCLNLACIIVKIINLIGEKINIERKQLS